MRTWSTCPPSRSPIYYIILGKWVSEAVSESVSEWVGEWVSEWVRQWVSEWVSEWTWSTCPPSQRQIYYIILGELGNHSLPHSLTHPLTPSFTHSLTPPLPLITLPLYHSLGVGIGGSVPSLFTLATTSLLIHLLLYYQLIYYSTTLLLTHLLLHY